MAEAGSGGGAGGAEFATYEVSIGARIPTPGRSAPTDRPGAFPLLLIALFVVISAWSLATPLMGAPDEPSQTYQAVALVRGQIDEPHYATRIGPLSVVRVPQWVLSATHLARCFDYRPAISGRCPLVVGSDQTIRTANTQFSNYPPLYFAWVGLPSLALSGREAFYAMRLASALVNASLLALGMYLLARYHPRRFPLVGALIAIPPMVLFMSAVINASGPEISAGFASWCAGLCVIEDRDIPKMLAIWTSIAFAAFILSRPLSPVNAGVVLVVLAALAGRRRLHNLRTAPRALTIGCAIVGAGVIAGITLLIGGSPSLLGVPRSSPLNFDAAFHAVLVREPGNLQQAVGSFGWLDTPVPHLVPGLWIALAAGVCAIGLLRTPRFLLALALLTTAIFLMPVIFEIPKINEVGTYWQGRYWLPLLVGIPLIATAASGHRPVEWLRDVLRSPAAMAARLVGIALVFGVIVWAQISSFVLALHRYTTGLGRPAGTPIEWTPPGGVVPVVTAFTVGELVLVGVLAWLVVRPDPADPHRGGVRRLPQHRHSRRPEPVKARV